MRFRLTLAIAIAALSWGCATQRQTGQAMTVVGAAAVIVGAASSANGCHVMTDVTSGEPVAASCYRSGLRKSAGTGVAIAGAGLAAAGYALQLTADGPDAVHPSARNPSASANPSSSSQSAGVPSATFSVGSSETSEPSSESEAMPGTSTPPSESDDEEGCMSIVCVGAD